MVLIRDDIWQALQRHLYLYLKQIRYNSALTINTIANV